MSAKGDARREHQSSWASTLPHARRSGWARYAQAAFVAYALWHLALQAVRAALGGAFPSAGVEVQPWFVTGAVLLVWLPFAAVAGREALASLLASGPAASNAARETTPGARALAVVEPYATAAVLVFALAHGALVAGPLLSGSSVSADVRPELIAALSGTKHGLPVLAIVYLCVVGATSFCAARQARRWLPAGRPPCLFAAVCIGLVCYLLGSYAVIRCASGSLWP